MNSFPEQMAEYKSQLKSGVIQKAYKGLMEYLLALKTHFKNKYPGYSVSGGLYFGYMDMSYFSVVPESFIQRNLKFAIVFLHEAFRFEVWVAGTNKQVQSDYWRIFKDSGWDQYKLVPTTKGADSILEHILVDDPDFSDLDGLTSQIEKMAVKFINDVDGFLSGQKS
jgi:hypothetical protein